LMLVSARFRLACVARDSEQTCHPGKHLCREGAKMTKFFNILLAATALAATPASAALQTLNFSGSVLSVNPSIPSAVAVNDAVTMSVTFDDSFFDDSFELEPGVFGISGPGAAFNFTAGSLVFTLSDFIAVEVPFPAIVFDYADFTDLTEVFFTGYDGENFLVTGVNLLGSDCPVAGCFLLSTGPDLENVYAYGTLTTESTGAVPEPASWAMLIAGFGLTGAAMRRRSRTAAAIA